MDRNVSGRICDGEVEGREYLDGILPLIGNRQLEDVKGARGNAGRGCDAGGALVECSYFSS